MSEYENSRSIQASPGAVFDFCSDLDNLPDYLPTLHHAQLEKGGKILVEGEVHGHQYRNDGYFHADRQQRRMEWGSDGDNKYSGWLRVDEDGRDASRVTVHLSFEPGPDQKREMAAAAGDHNSAIQEGLQKALQSLANLIEGRGGKVEVRGER